MNYQNIYEEIAYLLEDPAYARFGDTAGEPTWFKNRANDAYLEFCEQADSIITRVTPTSVEDQDEYDLSAYNPIKIVHVRFDGTPLIPTTEEQLDDLQTDGWLIETGKPKWFWVSKTNTIRVNPVPSATNDSLDIAIKISQEPTLMSGDADEPVIPRAYHRALVCGVVTWAKLLNQEPDYLVYLRQWLDYVERAKKRSVLGLGSNFLRGPNAQMLTNRREKYKR